jgi:hypothetical protein
MLSSAGQATQPDTDGELTLYDMMAEIGTVACREFHDESGRLIKVIHYTPVWPTTASASAATSAPAPPSLRGPFDPNNLAVCSIETYDYDKDGRRVRGSTYSAGGTLSGFATFAHDADGWLRSMRHFTADGRRQYEVRYSPPRPSDMVRMDPSWRPKRGREQSHLYFEENGERLVAVRGVLPDDVPWTWGWGPEESGLCCAVAPYCACGPLDKIAVAFTVRNTLEIPRTMSLGPGTYRPVLRDSTGRVVTISEGSKGARSLRVPQPVESSVRPGEAAHWDTLELAAWYNNLALGDHSLQLEYRGIDTEWRRVTNTITISIR